MLESAFALAVTAMTLGAYAAYGMRSRFAGFGFWRPVAFITGVAIPAATVIGPLDRLGERGLLTAHFAQHIALGDLAAPLLLIGLPPPARRVAARWLGTLAASRSRAARLASAALSPIGAFFLWLFGFYLWFVPALHAAATRSGPAHIADHATYLAGGFLIWLGAFDVRPVQTVLGGLRTGGMPWWARHIYAMSTRLALLPAGMIVWLSGVWTYHSSRVVLPFGYSAAADRERGASVLIGFEMLLFALAFVLAFVFASLAERHDREPADAGTR